jgi:YfiH family protein
MNAVPKPDPAFHWTNEVWGLALRCEPLSAVAQHLFTSKQLGLPAPERWGDATRSLHTTVDCLMRVKQVHGNTVRVVSQSDPASVSADVRPDGDAIVSNVAGLALAVMIADCVPILLADARTGAAAAVHAGWRGTCAGVAPAAIAALQREFGTCADDLIAAVGPSAGPDEYEVGESLVDAFREAGHSDASVNRWFRRGGAKPHLDLWTANRDQLIGSGVPAERVHLCGLSTVRYPQLLESYRVEGERAGRMSAIIVVPFPHR